MFMFENAGATQARASGEPTKAALARRLALIAAASVTPTVAFAEDAPEPRRGGVIEYGHEQEPPCLSGGWVQQWYLQRQFSDNLVSRTDAGGVAPWLATDWTLSDDRLTYTFGLKPNVFFTDGAPLDADAVVYNVRRWVSDDPETANNAASSYFKDDFASVDALDKETVRIVLRRPYQPFLDILTQSTFGIQSPAALARGAKANCESPVGSGPFIVDKWVRGRAVYFKRNPNYNSAPSNAKHQGPAYVDGLVWKFLKDPTVRYGSLARGQSDVIYNVPGVNWADAGKRFEIIQHTTGGAPLRFQLNTAIAPLNDERVRRAFAYATNRKDAIRATLHGATPYEGNAALASSSPEYLASLAGAYPYDPQQARRLLDEAGWTGAGGIRSKDGKSLTLRLVYLAGALVTNDELQTLQIIQEQARQVGFDIRLVPTTMAEFWAGKNRGVNDYDVQLTYWTATSAAVFRVVWRPGSESRPNPNNMSRFEDPRLWSLIQQADGAFDDDTRVKAYQDAQQLLSDSAAVVGFAPLMVNLAARPNLKDVWLSNAVGEPVFHDAYFVK